MQSRFHLAEYRRLAYAGVGPADVADDTMEFVHPAPAELHPPHAASAWRVGTQRRVVPRDRDLGWARAGAGRVRPTYFRWSQVAGLTNVAQQMHNLVSGGLSRLVLIIAGATVVDVVVRRRDSATQTPVSGGSIQRRCGERSAWLGVPCLGVGTGIGVAFLYRGLTNGRMSIVVPLSDVGAVALPVLAVLYPAIPVVLGLLVLRERLARAQIIGLGFVAATISLVAMG